MVESKMKKSGIAGAVMVPHPPLIIPDVGRGEERGIQATIDAYRRASEFVLSLHPDTIIISSPHSIMYRDYFHISPGNAAVGDFGRFRAPQVQISAVYDTALRDEICKTADTNGFPAGDLGERDPSLDHATMIPLWFLQNAADVLSEAVHAASASGTEKSPENINPLTSEASAKDSSESQSGASVPAPPFRILRVGLSGLPLPMHYELGQIVEQAAEKLGRRIVWIASGDLSHKLKSDGPYGFSKDGPVYDERIMKVMGSAAFDELFDFNESFLESAAECGHRSFVEMAGALDGLAVQPQMLSHEGPFGVGYGVCTFLVGARDGSRHCLKNWEKGKAAANAEKRQSEDLYVQLARISVEEYVQNREKLTLEDAGYRLALMAADSKKTTVPSNEVLSKAVQAAGPDPSESADSGQNEVLTNRAKASATANTGTAANELSSEDENMQSSIDAASDFRLPEEMLNARAGAFVSIHENGQLRGCIGTIAPVQENIAEEIIENAISASTRDPRFSPIRTDELPYLEITVDILSPAEKISAQDELDVKRYGVIVTKGMKRGLLLPNLDGVDTVPQQIAIAKQKAGIDVDDEDVELQRFEVVRHY